MAAGNQFNFFAPVVGSPAFVVSYLNNRGIGTSIHYPTPIHKQADMKNISALPLSFPVTEYQSNRILSLPMYPHLTESSQKYIAESIHQFYSN